MIDNSSNNDYDDSSTTKPKAPKKTDDEVNKIIAQLGDNLGKVENPYLDRYNQSSITYRWSRPINAEALFPGNTITYKIQIFDKSRKNTVFEQEIDESSAALRNIKNIQNQLFVKPTNLTAVTPYYIKIFATINEDKRYSSETTKLEIYTGPSSVRNLKIIRGKELPSSMIVGQWAPPNDNIDVQQSGVIGGSRFTYEVALQAAPKKNHKWESNTRDVLVPTYKWRELTSGQKYFLRIRSKISVTSAITRKTYVLQSPADVRFICTEPLPLLDFQVVEILDSSITIRFNLVKIFTITKNIVKGRPKVYVVDIFSLGRVDDKSGFQNAVEDINIKSREFAMRGRTSISPISQNETLAFTTGKMPDYKKFCKDMFLTIEEDKIKSLENDQIGHIIVNRLHPYCRYNVTIRSAVSCTTGIRREDLVISSFPSKSHIVKTLQSLPFRNNSVLFRDNWKVIPPREEELRDKNLNGKDLATLVNYTFPLNFVNDNNGPIIAYAIEIIFVEESADYSDYEDGMTVPRDSSGSSSTNVLFNQARAEPREFNPECSSILYPTAADNCPKWIAKWIPANEIHKLGHTEKQVFVPIGDQSLSKIPKELEHLVENIMKLNGNDGSENDLMIIPSISDDENLNSTLNNINTPHGSRINTARMILEENPLDKNKTKTVTTSTFQNKPLLEGYEYYFMALACTKVGCKRGIERYWMATRNKVPRSAFIEKTSVDEQEFPVWALIVIIIFVIIFICWLFVTMQRRSYERKHRDQDQERLGKNDMEMGREESQAHNNKRKQSKNFTPPSSDNEEPQKREPKIIIPSSKPIRIGDFCEEYGLGWEIYFEELTKIHPI